MGIEEYNFLTKTMGEIEYESMRLTMANEDRALLTQMERFPDKPDEWFSILDDPTPKSQKKIEKKIQSLWDSIGHLIPYSSELKKD